MKKRGKKTSGKIEKKKHSKNDSKKNENGEKKEENDENDSANQALEVKGKKKQNKRKTIETNESTSGKKRKSKSNDDADLSSEESEVESNANKELMSKKNKTNKLNQKNKNRKKNDESNLEEDDTEYEVSRILDVHFLKDGSRQFLVLWKGFPLSKSTWEPEENLNCAELIEKFLLRVENAKNSNTKELREVRKQTTRLVLNTQEQSRRLSKRWSGKQRVQYQETE